MAEIRLRRSPGDDVFVATQMAKARAAMGEAAFDAAEKSGRSHPWEQVMDDVQAWLGAELGGELSVDLGGDTTQPARRP